FFPDQPLNAAHKLRHGHLAFVAFAASTDADFARLRFFVSYNQKEGHFLQGVLADLGIHLLVALIHVNAYTGRAELITDVLPIDMVPLADRNNHRLHRRQPDRKRARIMFDEHTEESLYRTIKR